MSWLGTIPRDYESPNWDQRRTLEQRVPAPTHLEVLSDCGRHTVEVPVGQVGLPGPLPCTKQGCRYGKRKL